MLCRSSGRQQGEKPTRTCEPTGVKIDHWSKRPDYPTLAFGYGSAEQACAVLRETGLLGVFTCQNVNGSRLMTALTIQRF